MMKLTRVSFPRRAVLAALFAAVCFAQTGGSTSWGSAAKSPDFLPESTIDKGAPRSILLIGENHASVKTQTQLAEFLERLYREHAVDAVLVEGSNGKIDASNLRDSLAKVATKDTAGFWKGQLDLGQIAGYEYVALTRDGVRIWGVEDMEAKRKYTSDAAKRGAQTGLQDQIDMHQRALALASEASAPLDSGMRQRAGVDTAVNAYKSAIQRLKAFQQADGVRYADAEGVYADGIERVTALYSKVRPILPTYDQVAKAAGPYNRLLERAKKIAAGEPAPAGTDPAKLLADFKAAKSRVEAATADFDAALHKAGYADEGAVLADLQQIRDAQDKITSSEESIKTLAVDLGKIESDLTNRFFVVANAVRGGLGKPAPALQGFLRDERQRDRANGNDPEKPYLNERDKFMVANTLAYLDGNPGAKRVALIIGYAHLEGMTKRLRQANVNILAGKIAASEEETEAWENRAWERRSRPAAQIFSHPSRKELSRLLDETYKQEVAALVSRLETVSVNGDGLALGKTKTFEGAVAGSRKVIVATPDSASLRADWGDQVLGLGTLPDGSGSYLIVDRSVAHEEAKALSSRGTMFATAYRTKGANGKVVTNLDLPDGTVGLAAFKARAPRQGKGTPKRVVIAAEGDANALNTAVGSGGSGEPPAWTARLAGFAEPPEGRRPSLFFTKNMRRANERLAAMDKQDPLKIGQIASFEIGLGPGTEHNTMDDLWFTPDAGDHARAYLIAGDNTAEFRQKLKEAADAGLLRNKQIALATCFDANETDAIRDMLLEGGALMVWTPQNRISPEAARKLRSFMEKVDEAGGEPVRGLDEYMDRALGLWYKDSKDDPDLKPLLNSTNTAEERAPDTLEAGADT